MTEREGANCRRGALHSLHRGSLLAWSPYPVPSSDTGDSAADIFGDSGQWRKHLAHLSALLRSSPEPRSGGLGHGSGRRRLGRAEEGRPYRGRSVLLCRVFRAVPSSRGSALCRLDMATVFLRSITA